MTLNVTSLQDIDITFMYFGPGNINWQLFTAGNFRLVLWNGIAANYQSDLSAWGLYRSLKTFFNEHQKVFSTARNGDYCILFVRDCPDLVTGISYIIDTVYSAYYIYCPLVHCISFSLLGMFLSINSYCKSANTLPLLTKTVFCIIFLRI